MIQIDNLTFGYTKRQSLFNKLTIDFHPGKIYGLLGKNGTGKTSLLKLMSGLLTPRTGSCKLNDVNSHDRVPGILKELFIVPEEFILPSIKMSQFVAVNAPFYPKFNHQQFQESAKEFELPANSRINSLSFGQRKKFLLAFGIATNVSILFLDEPTNGLDIPSKSQFRKTVARAINDDRSIVISTHQVRDLENLIDTIVILEKGKIIFNQDHTNISRKLSFEKTHNPNEENNILYQEEILGGYRVVRRAKPETESIVDLELLFNAVVNNNEKIINQF